MQVGSDQVRELREDGVTCLRGLLDERWLADCLEGWTWSVSNPGPLASPLIPGTSTAFQDLCNPGALDRYRKLLLESPLADAVVALWQSPDVWFMYEQVFHKWDGAVGRTPWHQDSPYLAVGGTHLLVAWISFEALPPERSLEFVRGSHRGTLYDGSRFDPRDPTAPLYGTGELPRLPDIEADRDAWDIVRFGVEPGDVVAFHPAMLHGGGPVCTDHPVRRTLSLRFFGDDAHYEKRPGPAGPFYADLRGTLMPGDPFRHPRFLKLR